VTLENFVYRSTPGHHGRAWYSRSQATRRTRYPANAPPRTGHRTVQPEHKWRYPPTGVPVPQAL
jgi:hypothetical protein